MTPSKAISNSTSHKNLSNTSSIKNFSKEREDKAAERRVEEEEVPGLQASFTVSIGVRKPTLYRIELHTCSYWSLIKKAMNEKYVKTNMALFCALLSYMGSLATLLIV
jgi:hypothetical protein